MYLEWRLCEVVVVWCLDVVLDGTYIGVLSLTDVCLCLGSAEFLVFASFDQGDILFEFI